MSLTRFVLPISHNLLRGIRHQIGVHFLRQVLAFAGRYIIVTSSLQVLQGTDEERSLTLDQLKKHSTSDSDRSDQQV
jgi:hypothetical protein